MALVIWAAVAPGESVVQTVVRFGMPPSTPGLFARQSIARDGSRIPDHSAPPPPPPPPIGLMSRPTIDQLLAVVHSNVVAGAPAQWAAWPVWVLGFVNQSVLVVQPTGGSKYPSCEITANVAWVAA